MRRPTRISRNSSGGKSRAPTSLKISLTSCRPPTRKGKGKAKTEDALSSAIDSLSVTEPKHTAPAEPEEPSADEITAEEAELYIWDGDNEEFAHQDDVVAKIIRPSADAFEYWIIASTAQGQVLAHKINPDMNQKWALKMQSLTWNYHSDNNTYSSWLFRFPTKDAYESFQAAFTQALWEGLHQAPWAKAKVRKYDLTVIYRLTLWYLERRTGLHEEFIQRGHRDARC